MPHCDPDVLSLRALGEPAGTAADDDHLRGCAACQAELDQLRAVVTASRSIIAEDHPVPPPDLVWDRISDELGLAADSADSAGGPAAGPAQRQAEPVPEPTRPPADPRPRPAPMAADDAAGDRPAGSAGDAVTMLPARPPASWVRRRTATLLAAAAAVTGLVLGGGLALLLGGGDDSPGAAQGQVIAQAPLQPLPAKQASGEATVSGTGTDRALEVRVRGLPAGSGFYQVWLLDRAASKLISVGVLDADRGTFALPPSIDLRQYPVVDVSLEPFDGDPAHSKDSFVRGTLEV